MRFSRSLAATSRRTRTQARAAWLSAVAVVVAGAASHHLLRAAPLDEPLITNVARFQIPFDVEAEPGQPLQGFAVLFGSQDGGAHWDQLQRVPVAQQAFNFAAPRDGRYSFAIRITDAQGNLESAIEGSVPELDVIVDSVPPELSLTLSERAGGEVVVNWSTVDSAVAPDSLALEYADGADGRWKPVTVQPAANGQCVIPVTAGSVVSVRAAIMDVAGNRADASSQLITRSAPNTDPRDSHLAPIQPGQPLGPSPFNSFPGSFSSDSPAPQAPSDVTARYPEVSPAALLPVPSGVASPSSSQMTAGSHSISGDATSFAAGTPSFSVQSTFQPGPPMLLNTATGDMQIVNNRVFDLEYQIEDVGPSGVSAVELFVTENGGQQWFRYGNDADLRSPFSVDAQGEGTFGFAVRIRNGLGFADHPPQPGQAPEIVVTVDQTPPQVELLQPTVRTDGFGSVALTWRVNESYPSASPVRLEFASTPNGPWSPVFDWQTDQGGHQWAVRPGMPPAVYFRLLARDAAGNVGVASTPQPVVVDVKKPVGRLLRVHTASQSSTWP